MHGCGVNHSIAELDQNARPPSEMLIGFRIFDVEVSNSKTRTRRLYLGQSYPLGFRGLALLSSQRLPHRYACPQSTLVRGYNLIKCMLYHRNPLQYRS